MFWPIAGIWTAIWSFFTFILKFTGRVVAIILGAIFVFVGVIFTISVTTQALTS